MASTAIIAQLYRKITIQGKLFSWTPGIFVVEFSVAYFSHRKVLE